MYVPEIWFPSGTSRSPWSPSRVSITRKEELRPLPCWTRVYNPPSPLTVLTSCTSLPNCVLPLSSPINGQRSSSEVTGSDRSMVTESAPSSTALTTMPVLRPSESTIAPSVMPWVMSLEPTEERNVPPASDI